MALWQEEKYAETIITAPVPRRSGGGESRGRKPFGARCGGGLPGEGRESRGQSPLALSAEDITPANPFYKSIAFFLLCCKRKQDIITADHKIGVRMPLPIKEMFA